MDSRKTNHSPSKTSGLSTHTEPRLDVHESCKGKGIVCLPGKMGPTGHRDAPAAAVGPPSSTQGQLTAPFLSSQ